jgi:hypothetical protein
MSYYKINNCYRSFGVVGFKQIFNALQSQSVATQKTIDVGDFIQCIMQDITFKVEIVHDFGLFDSVFGIDQQNL